MGAGALCLAALGACAVTHDIGGGLDASGDAGSDAGQDAGTSPCGDVSSSSANCGQCGHDCRGGACVEGRCRPTQIGTTELGIEAIVLDDDSLYMIRPSVRMVPAAIVRLPKNGGVVTELASEASGERPVHIATDGTNVYWLTWASDLALRSIPVDGGPVSTLTTGVFYGQGLLVDGPWLYFTSSEGLFQMPSGGGTVSLIRQAFAFGLAVHPSESEFIASDIYFTVARDASSCPNRILRVSTAGEIPTVVRTEPGCIELLGIAGGYLYWMGDGGILRVGLSGGAPEEIPVALEQGESVRAAALDETHLYLGVARATDGRGSFRRVSLDDWTVEEVATTIGAPGAIALDDHFAFFGDVTFGTVLRLAK